MQFRTELNLLPLQTRIQYTDSIFLIGSCFSQNIGSYLQKYKFNITSNPFGTIFNPISIAKVLEAAALEAPCDRQDLHQSQGRWVHPDFHSILSDSNPETTLDRIQQTTHHVHQRLQSAKVVFITLGTSHAYVLKEKKSIVANCHKLPAQLFEKILLSPDDCIKALSKSMALIQKINPNVHFVLTVSPVRHIKDGIVENQRSKARLIEVTHTLIDMSPDSVSYFPAYEWLMDDLRDYRYYADDLVHPSDLAIQYIWEKFYQHYFDKNTIEIMTEVGDVIKASHHKHFNPNSEETVRFKQQYVQRIESLENRYPFLHFDEEMKAFM